MATKHPSSRRYPPEVKQRAVELTLRTMRETGERHAVIARIARKLDIGAQTLSPLGPPSRDRRRHPPGHPHGRMSS